MRSRIWRPSTVAAGLTAYLVVALALSAVAAQEPPGGGNVLALTDTSPPMLNVDVDVADSLMPPDVADSLTPPGDAFDPDNDESDGADDAAEADDPKSGAPLGGGGGLALASKATTAAPTIGDAQEVSAAAPAVAGDAELSAAPATTAAESGPAGEPSGGGTAVELALRAALNMSLLAPGGMATAVLERGKAVGDFAACTEATSGTCWSEDVFDDRAHFDLRFDPEAVSNAELTELLTGLGGDHLAPRVRSSTGRANPSVPEVKIDAASASGTITVKYRCAGGGAGNETSFLTMHVPLSVSSSVNISWTKVCGSGPMEHLKFGYLDHNRKSVLFNGDGTHGDEKEVGLEVSPHDLSTILTLQLEAPVYALDFHAPFVTSSRPDDVQHFVRGARSDGTMLSIVPPEVTEVSIMYECKASVSAEFSVTIGIPPWKNLTASWTKDCGGRVPKSLLVGTTISSSFDVLQSGELSQSFNVSGLASAYEARRRNVYFYDEDAHAALFYLTNADDTSNIRIQSVTVTMMPSGLMSTEIENPTLQPLIGDGYLSRSGATLGRHEAKRLALHFYCRSAGDVVVLVTLATLLYQNVEFGFVKACKEGKVYHHSALTAGSFMTAIFLAFLATAAMGCCYFVRRKRHEATLLKSATRKTGRGRYELVDDSELVF
jgi:hypothetical protein